MLDVGTAEQAGPGKRATLVDLDRARLLTLAVDLSVPARLQAAVLDITGEVRRARGARRRRSTPPRAVGSTPPWSSSSCSPRSPAPRTPCSASASERRASSTATAPCARHPNLGWTDVPLRELVADATGLPVLVTNDSDAATQAELSASPGSEDMVLVHVGRGVGCGIVTGGRRVAGAHHAAGEIGHVTVGTDGGEDCPCGKRGCLETWLSIPRLRAALDGPDGHDVVEVGGRAPRGRPRAARRRPRPLRGRPRRSRGAAGAGPPRPRADALRAPARGPRLPRSPSGSPGRRRTSSCAAQPHWSSGTSWGSSRPPPPIRTAVHPRGRPAPPPERKTE